MNQTPRILWQPSADLRNHSNLSQYCNWLRINHQKDFSSYQSLWQWSVDEPSDFWETLVSYFDIQFHQPYTQVQEGSIPRTRWFVNGTLNYAEHVFRNQTDQYPALLVQSEQQPLTEMSWADLRRHTAALAAWLRQQGIQKGDRVAAYLPNCPEATIGLLATLSIGAIWSSTSPDFGLDSVKDRFSQIEPKILIAVGSYGYGGKEFNKQSTVEQLREHLPSVQEILWIRADRDTKGTHWSELPDTETLTFEPVEFNHPIWVLFSSGTTGLPKPIVHSHGGVLLEHLKYLTFHNDVRPGERFFWYTTTGWMMWNFLNASLLCGATAVLYDGSPGYPDLNVLWKLTEEARIHHFGTSASFIHTNLKKGIQPSADLSSLRTIGSTGSPLSPEGFDWIYEHIKSDVWLSSMSGGTDVCTAWIGGNPWLPVYEGEIQCRCLGCAMEAWDENGHALRNEVGEMVVTKAMPSMPVFFWNDPDFTRYTESYFEEFPGNWRHGDWLKITDRDTLVILGRSDATLNRQGVRIGTAEIYQAVDKLPEVKDSTVIHLEEKDFMPLFVVLNQGYELTDELKRKINQQIRLDYSPRHVPDEIISVPDLPYTISGKKLEKPIKQLLQGKPLDKLLNPDSLRNPDSIRWFQTYAETSL